MLGANLALIVLLGQVPAADPSALVMRLGSPRYAEREEAAGALERLGRPAIPPLRAARDARDPEIRTRAGALIHKIEGALLTQPTLVTLDFEDRPLPEVVKAVGDRAGIKLGLIPENAPAWPGRRITLHETGPVPFWKAIDRLCDAARLQYHFGNHGVSGGREPVLPLLDGGPRLPGPTSDSGPFRVSLVSLHYQRDVTFSHAVAPPHPAFGGRRGGPGAGPGHRIPTVRADGIAINEQFYAQVQVAAEPRLLLSQNGPLKILEAVDDRGQSLLPEPDDGAVTQRFSGYFGLTTGSALQLHAPLKRPEQPGRSIRKLRGLLPVLVATRKPDPLVVPLQGAAGKSFGNDHVNLGIVEIRLNPVTHQTNIDLVVRSNDSPAPGLALPGADRSEFLAPRPEMHQQQIEIVDSQGRMISWYHSSFDAEGSRMTLTLTPPDQANPSEIRYYGLARAATEVGFEFNDVPMP